MQELEKIREIENQIPKNSAAFCYIFQ